MSEKYAFLYIVAILSNYKKILYTLKTYVHSLLFLVSRICTPPELKFNVFGTSKHGEEKSISNIFFLLYLSVHCGDFI